MVTATTQSFAIIMTENEDMTTNVRRWKELHNLEDGLREAVPPMK